MYLWLRLDHDGHYAGNHHRLAMAGHFLSHAGRFIRAVCGWLRSFGVVSRQLVIYNVMQISLPNYPRADLVALVWAID